MTGPIEIRLRVSVAWWLNPYLWMLAHFAAWTGCEIDEAKAEAVIMRAIRVEII